MNNNTIFLTGNHAPSGRDWMHFDRVESRAYGGVTVVVVNMDKEHRIFFPWDKVQRIEYR